jgi:glycosyltransferase involved in cell wall biosynthesis
MSQRILLLSAYDAQSHRYWRQQLVKNFAQHQFEIITLKDRHFAWRMGGNALSFKAQYDTQLCAEYDVVLATSMTDLSTLLGLYPNLSKLPKHLYFHENQFAYPTNNQQQGLLEIQMRSIYAALAADKLWFNSNYNRDTFTAGVNQLVNQMPDGIPEDLIENLSGKSAVLPVPIDDDCQPLVNQQTESQTIQVVWNHRWEHDKGLETLLEVMRLCRDKPHIKFHIIGQQFRNTPVAMQQIIDHHQDQCLTLGYIESRTQYIETLQCADVVLSTATHDFQGLAMLEAVACGCLPIAPNSLVYPELYPASNLYPSNPHTPKIEAQVIVKKLNSLQLLQSTQPPFYWQQLYSFYEKLFQ